MKKDKIDKKDKYVYAYCQTTHLNKDRKWWQFNKPKYTYTKQRVRIEKCD